MWILKRVVYHARLVVKNALDPQQVIAQNALMDLL